MHHPRFGAASSRAVTRTTLLVALAAVVSGASAQEEARRDGIFLDSVDVSLVNLEVLVTTPDGEPVTDLALDDFEVLDDGMPVEVTHFSRVGDGRVVAEDPAPGEPAAQGPVPEPYARAPAVILILVDQAFISSPNRKLVFDRLAEHLDTLLSGNTQVMVVSKARTIEVVQRLTPHRTDVLAALDRLARQAVPDYSTELRRVLRNVARGRVSMEEEDSYEGPTSAETEARMGLQEARDFSQQVYADVQRSLKLLRGFLRALAGLPGRKAVIYVADRLPIRPGEIVWQAWFDQYGDNWGWQLGVSSAFEEVGSFDTSNEIRELIATAGANRVAFYPIGGRIAGAGLMGAESSGLRPVTGSAHLGNTSSDGLVWLARDTGGQAALDSSGKKRFFDQLRRDLASFYSLGFPSPHRGDGESHEVEVRVRRAGVKVRYLSRYRDKSPRQEAEERLLASLVLDVGENGLDVRAEIGPPTRPEGPEGTSRVPLRIEIPIANLQLVPGRKSHAAKVSIHIMVRDEKGRLSEPVDIDLPLEVPNGALLRALTESFSYSTHLTLRSGRQTIGIGVHDELGSTTSVVNIRANLGADG